MKKIIILFLFSSLFIFSVTQQANAFPNELPNKSKALGYDIDLNGFTYRLGSIGSLRFDISIGFGLDIKTAGKTKTTFDITPGFRVLIPVVKYKAWLVQAVTGVHSTMTFGDRTDLGFSLFGGLMPEIFLLPNLSIEIMIGVALALNDVTNDIQVTLGTVGKGISIISGAAFHWYF